MVTREKNTSRVSRNNSVAQNRNVGPKRVRLNLWGRAKAIFDNYFLHQSFHFYKTVMLILFIVGLGLVSVFSASHVSSIKTYGNPFFDFFMQTVFAIAGLLCMVVLSTMSSIQIEKFGRFLLACAVGGQLLVKVPGIGRSAGGNSNWIAIGPITIQPSEFLKLGMIIYLATLIAPKLDEMDDFHNGPKQFITLGMIGAGAVAILGNDLGTAIVMVLVLLLMLFLLNMPSYYLLRITAAVVALGVIAIMSSGSRRARFGAFIARILDPSQISLDGTGWQTEHGFWGLAFGGITGNGLGQSKLDWGWIPEIQNDFIFANIGEEHGLLGALLVILLFFALAKYILHIANSTPDPFARVVSIGVMLWLLVQAYINIAVVLGLGPVLGVPLPLISKGGSSLLAVMMALGVVLSFERNSQSVPVRSSRRI